MQRDNAYVRTFTHALEFRQPVIELGAELCFFVGVVSKLYVLLMAAKLAKHDKHGYIKLNYPSSW